MYKRKTKLSPIHISLIALAILVVIAVIVTFAVKKDEPKEPKMIAIGNLTGDPVLKTNEETGKPYAIMRIASDRRYKSPDGEKLTDFISIKVRGVLAERCAEFARKGCKIAASGDFETITFAEEPERQPGFLLKATEVEFLSPRKELDDAAELPAAA